MAAFGCSWLRWAAPGCFWLLLAASGCSWLLLVAFGSSWLLFPKSRKNTQNWYPKAPQIGQNPAPEDSKSTSIRPWWALGPQGGQDIAKASIFEQFWTPLGHPLGTLWEHFWPPKCHFKGTLFGNRFLVDFRRPLELPGQAKVSILHDTVAFFMKSGPSHKRCQKGSKKASIWGPLGTLLSPKAFQEGS